MRRLAPTVLLAPLLLVAAYLIACSGDDAPSATPTASPTIDTFPTIERPPTPTPTPEGAILSIGPPQTLTTRPIDVPSFNFPPYVYDVETQALLDPASPEYAAATVSLAPKVLWQSETTVAVLQLDGSWLESELPGNVRSVVASPHAPTAAVSVSETTFLLDTATMSARPLSGLSEPVSFSPDGALLLLSTPAGHVVLPVAEPSAAFALPAAADSANFLGEPRWLDATTLITVRGREPLLQIFDLSGPQPRVTLEQPVPVAIMSLSRDGSRVAVDADGVTTVYELNTFEPIAELTGASIGEQYSIPSGIWSADASRILVNYGRCTEAERLVAVDLVTGAETLIAEGGIMRWSYSPDDAWIAYTSWPEDAFVIATAAGSLPILVTAGVHGPFGPTWSTDSRYVSFPPVFGGYDRCLF